MYNSKLVEALESLTSGIENAEERPGQVGMALAVDSSIANDEHLVVEAGTGTGKTLAYLLPYALAGKTLVVATFTKALSTRNFIPSYQHEIGGLCHIMTVRRLEKCIKTMKLSQQNGPTG